MIEWIVSSSILILLISAIRFFFRNRLALRGRYALWLLVALRLLVPVSLWTSSYSVLNLLEMWAAAEAEAAVPSQAEADKQENSMDPGKGQPGVNGEWQNAYVSEDVGTAASEITENVGNLSGSIDYGNGGSNVGNRDDKNTGIAIGNQDNGGKMGGLLYWIWLWGVILCAAIVAAGNFIYRRRLYRSRKLYKPRTEGMLPVYKSSVVSIPCLFGLAHPAVYLNPGTAKECRALNYVLDHENTHYRHRDNLWALVRTACVCIHWYNPLVWLAARLSRQDSELACDEGVLGKLGERERIEYGRALLSFSVQENGMLGSLQPAITISGGKRQLKERLMVIVQRVKRSKGAFVWTFVLALLVSAFAFTGKMDTRASDAGEADDGASRGIADEDDGTGFGASGDRDDEQDEGRMEYYVREVPIDLGDGENYVLRINSGTIPGTGRYRIDQIALCRIRDGGEEILQTIRAGEAKVLYTKAMGGIEPDSDSAVGQWQFSAEGDTLFAKPLYSLEELPGQATNAFMEGDGEMWAYAPDGGILVEDLNFDGYNDICLQAGVGSVNLPYYCYLWNDGRFEYGYMIPNVQVNWGARILESVTKDGDGIYSVKYYRFDRQNTLHLVRYVEENQSPDAVFPILDLRYCEDGYYTLPAVDEWDYGTEYGGALTERLVYWAKQALTELYEWSGTKIDTAYFSTSAFGDFFFGNSLEDIRASRVFFDRAYGAKAGFIDCIESMWITTERSAWYSPVTQWNVPDDLDHMTNAQVVEWYFGLAAVAAGEKVADIEESFENTFFLIRTESGKYYLMTLEPVSREVDSVYGPYNDYPNH